MKRIGSPGLSVGIYRYEIRSLEFEVGDFVVVEFSLDKKAVFG